MNSFFPANESALISIVATTIVGATLLWAGGIKAVSPHVFRVHLGNLGFPRSLLTSAVTASAATETGWGLAVILRAEPHIILPATVLMLALFSAVSWWGVRSGRTTDCGCYGGYVVPSPAQSLLMNAALIILTLFALRLGGFTPTAPWKLIAITLGGLVAGGLAAASTWFYRTRGHFMIDLNPLKVGRAWRARWGAELPIGSEHLVSYLGPDCPHCKQWVRILNTMTRSRGLPDVVGIVATSDEKLQAFVESTGIRFPMRTIPQTLMSRLAWGVPTTVLVSEGKIQKYWSGQMPPDFFARFRNAYFPPGVEPPSESEATPLATRST